MNFTFETQYNMKTMIVMSKALRKTVQKKRSQRFHLFGWIAAVLDLFLVIRSPALDFQTVVDACLIPVFLIALLFEDFINGCAAKRQLLPGTETAVTVFSEEGFVTTTAAGKSEWDYGKIAAIAENPEAFVFIFGPNHAQLYDKGHLTGGTTEEFRNFIQRKTGKSIVSMK